MVFFSFVFGFDLFLEFWVFFMHRFFPLLLMVFCGPFISNISLLIPCTLWEGTYNQLVSHQGVS